MVRKECNGSGAALWQCAPEQCSVEGAGRPKRLYIIQPLWGRLAGEHWDLCLEDRAHTVHLVGSFLGSGRVIHQGIGTLVVKGGDVTGLATYITSMSFTSTNNGGGSDIGRAPCPVNGSISDPEVVAAWTRNTTELYVP